MDWPLFIQLLNMEMTEHSDNIAYLKTLVELEKLAQIAAAQQQHEADGQNPNIDPREGIDTWQSKRAA